MTWRLESGLEEDASTISGMLVIPLLAEGKEDLMKLLQTVKKESVKVHLYLNLKKTKILSNEKIDVFRLRDDHMEIVRSFIFLGSKIEVSG